MVSGGIKGEHDSVVVISARVDGDRADGKHVWKNCSCAGYGIRQGCTGCQQTLARL